MKKFSINVSIVVEADSYEEAEKYENELILLLQEEEAIYDIYSNDIEEME